MNRSFISVGAALALTILVTGCGPKSACFKDVKSAVFNGSEKLNTSVELNLGLFPIWLAGTVVGFVDEPEAKEAGEYLDHVSRVELGVYEVQNSLRGRFHEIADHVKDSMQENGFEPLVLVREKNECVGIYVPVEDKKLARELFVVVLEKKEVVLVRVRGNFEKISRAILRNHAHEIPFLTKGIGEGMLL